MTAKGPRISRGEQGIKSHRDSSTLGKRNILFLPRKGCLMSMYLKHSGLTQQVISYMWPGTLWHKSKGQGWRLYSVDGKRSGFSETGMEGYFWTSVLHALGRWWITSTSAILRLLILPLGSHMRGKRMKLFFNSLYCSLDWEVTGWFFLRNLT